MSRHDCRRCDWVPSTAGEPIGPLSQLADHAADTGHWLCVVCGLSLPAEVQQTCIPCIADTRQRLNEVVEMYAALPGELGHPTASPLDAPGGPLGDETPLPGGDALTLLSNGSEGRLWRGRVKGDRLAHTPWRAIADEIVLNDNLPSDAPSAAFELSRWEDAFREDRGESVAMTEATVSGAVAYLEPVVGWAGAHHPAFDEFADDVRRLHRKLQDVTGRSERPTVGTTCFEEGCSAQLLRQNGEDHYRCPRCRREYDDASYWLAVKAEMEEQVKKDKRNAEAS